MEERAGERRGGDGLIEIFSSLNLSSWCMNIPSISDLIIIIVILEDKILF